MTEIIWSDDGGGNQPDERAKTIAVLEECVRRLSHYPTATLLPGPVVFNFYERDLPAILKTMGTVNRVRVEQSYSQAKAKASAE